MPTNLGRCWRGRHSVGNLEAASRLYATMWRWLLVMVSLYERGARSPAWCQSSPGGGLSGRMLSLFSFPLIRERFHDKGRHAAWLETVPLYFIRSPHAALTGAAIAYSRR